MASVSYHSAGPDEPRKAASLFWTQLVLGLLLVLAGIAIALWLYGWICSLVDPIWFWIGVIALGLIAGTVAMTPRSTKH